MISFSILTWAVVSKTASCGQTGKMVRAMKECMCWGEVGKFRTRREPDAIYEERRHMLRHAYTY